MDPIFDPKCGECRREFNSKLNWNIETKCRRHYQAQIDARAEVIDSLVDIIIECRPFVDNGGDSHEALGVLSKIDRVLGMSNPSVA
jgi:hypothetical protein